MKLPKKVKRREAELDGKVAEKLAKLHPHRNWALEVKVAPNKLEPHQRAALKQVENGCFKPYKLPDDGRRQPFDIFYLGDADAIVCTIDEKRYVTCDVNSGVMSYKFRV